jgi:hypothetical protein
MKRSYSLTAVLAASLLAACGGSSDSHTEPTDPQAGATVPASATASPQAFSQFVASLAENNQAEPLDLDAVQPPTSETEEPIDLS